jgi:A/G-specific adenine glycosylase
MVDATAPEPRRRVAERREAPFAGSSRFYRGRIVEALRQLPPDRALELRALGGQVKRDYGDEDTAWLRALVEGLARDGLLVLEGDTVRLP